MTRTSVHWAWGIVGGAALGWYYGDSWTETAAGALIGSPWGATAIAYGTRGTFRAGVWAASTTPVRGAALAAGRFAGTAALAVAVPVVLGYGVSHAIAGEQGRDDYVDFMTGGVSPGQWWDAVTLKSMRG